MSECSNTLVRIATSTLPFPFCLQEDCCILAEREQRKIFWLYAPKLPYGMMYKRESISFGMKRTVFTMRWMNHSSIHYVCKFTKSLLIFAKSFIVRWDQMLCSLSFQLRMKDDLLQKVTEDHFLQLSQGQASSALTYPKMVKAILGQLSQGDKVCPPFRGKINMLTKSLGH